MIRIKNSLRRLSEPNGPVNDLRGPPLEPCQITDLSAACGAPRADVFSEIFYVVIFCWTELHGGENGLTFRQPLLALPDVGA